MQDRFDVVIVGAGAAGISALRRLGGSGLSSIVLEARPRIGGRAQTVLARPDLPVDSGCGWLHSADVNPLAKLVVEAGFEVDRTPPHWLRQAGNQDFPPADQDAFGRAFADFQEKLEKAATTGVDRPASELMEPGGRWNHLLDAISSYYNGAEYDQVSVVDYGTYEDDRVNWRVAQGYGAAIASFADLDRIVTDCAVTTIHHDGPRLQLETARGAIEARAVIVTVPTPLIAEARLRFSPDLPAVREACDGLPLGLADKVFFGLHEPEMFPVEGHLFGRIDRTATGSYHLRPFGRPYVEVYLGGRQARALEAEGRGAATAFATDELVNLVGSDVRRKIHPLGETAWASDPHSLGAYSHALPGRSGARAVLYEPIDDRIFLAGEAVSAHSYSTAHGAWRTGEDAAGAAIRSLGSSSG
jgi:monoamine oxidase